MNDDKAVARLCEEMTWPRKKAIIEIGARGHTSVENVHRAVRQWLDNSCITYTVGDNIMLTKRGEAVLARISGQ